MKPENNYHALSSDNFGTDIVVTCEGTIFLFEPLTAAAKHWIDENVQPDAQWFGNALVVEWRYAAELAAAMRADGLVLA
jgi:hypothetical protein